VEDEEAVLALLDVAVVALVRLDDLEPHLARRGNVRRHARHLVQLRDLRVPHGVKGEVAEVLARLDVVLVGVRPVEFHLLAAVGDRIRRRRVVGLALQVAERDEIALVVVALEEVVEMVIDVRLGLAARRRPRQGRARRLVGLRQRDGRIRSRHRPVRRDRIRAQPVHKRRLGRVKGLSALRPVRRRERRLDLLRQPFDEKGVDLLRLRVHHTIEAEVKVGFVELEKLTQLVL